MKTPVIIPAYNEERHIARTLERLPSALVEPIVAVNGSTDRTADIAESFGVQVLRIPEQGKLPAIQRALEQLGARALEPLLLLDADAYPRNPVKWHNHMLGLLSSDKETPTVATGMHWFTPTTNDVFTPVVRSLFAIGETILKSGKEVTRTGINGGQYGANVGLHIFRKAILDEVIALDHFWPKEDRALTRAIVRHDGIFKQSLSLDALVFTTEPLTYPTLLETFKYGTKLGEAIDATYIERGAPGSRPYDEYETLGDTAQDIES